MTARPWPARPWPDAVPLYATKRTDRPTVGPEVVDIGRRLGFECMPWQCDLFDVMYELDEHGHLWYREARITVPRQSAKTTSALMRHVDRQVNGARRGWGDAPVTLFTMQHASSARKKLVETWMPIVERSEWAQPHTKHVLSNGKEAIKWPEHGGGRIETFPPTGKGAHGDVIDLVDIDEAFAMVDDRAESGSRPAMITRPSPQLVIESTAGTSESLYLLDKVKDGRERVESGLDSHVMYLEYAADVERGADIHDSSQWWRWLPALGYTQSLEALKIEHDNYMGSTDPEKGEAGWARAFANLWTASEKRLIPAKSWSDCFSPGSTIVGRRWLAVDASPSFTGNRWSAVAVSGYTEDGRLHSEVLKFVRGLDWVTPYLSGLTRRHTFESIRLDPKSPIGAVRPDIEREVNANVIVTDTETMAAACSRFHEDIIDGRFAHIGQPMLDAAAEGAAKRQLLDGWAFARRTSSNDISPLVAATLSHWDAASNPNSGIIRMAVAR